MNSRSMILVLMLAVAGVMVSCKSKTGGKKMEVRGVISGAAGKTLYLEEVPVATMQRIIVDSAVIDTDGKYSVEANVDQQSIFNVRIDPVVYRVLNDASRITLNATYNPADPLSHNYEVDGSEASEQWKEFMRNFNNELSKLYTIAGKADSLLRLQVADSVYKPLRSEHSAVAENMKRVALDAIAKSNNPALSMFILGYYQTSAANQTLGLEGLTDNEVKRIVSGVTMKYPDHQGVAAIKRELDVLPATPTPAASEAWVGKTAPEISLRDQNGKEIKLSSYRGKYVLVDFWASWCGPCRRENPNVVNAYNKYKDKNFDILGVSLDTKKDAWLKAIRDDQLTWKHISDLKGWESVVVPMYNFGQVGIPYNVLVDPEGKVIAERLNGAALDAKLSEVLNGE